MLKDPVDPRSTWRKRARKVLDSVGRPEWCENCGRSPTDKEAPGGYYPGMGTLQVNHKSKVLADIDPANLERLCPSCHKEVDSVSAKGVDPEYDRHGYGLDLLNP